MPRHHRLDDAVTPEVASATPADASAFHVITQSIKRRGRPAGWAKARDLILDRFPVFAAQWGGYQALKAALEIDRHAMFAEVHQVATESRFKREVWDQFQAFLKGEVAQPPSRYGAQVGDAILDVDALEALDEAPGPTPTLEGNEHVA